MVYYVKKTYERTKRETIRPSFKESRVAVGNTNKSYVQTVILISATILCAILARVLSKLGYAHVTLGLIRTMIYIGLYTA